MKREWAIYFGILAGNLIAVLLITGSLLAAVVATSGAVLAATHAAAMIQRQQRAVHPIETKHQS